LEHQAEPGSGKTKLLTIEAGASFNGILRVNPTPASLFRLIEANRITLCLDEMEGIGGDDRRELLSILNAGYKQGGAVDRTEGDKRREIVPYAVYSPVALAGVKGVHSTTAERCISVPMQRGLDAEKINTTITIDDPILQGIRAMCYRLLLSQWERVVKMFTDLDPPTKLTGRQRELWSPLMTVAVLVDKGRYCGAMKDLCAVAIENIKGQGGLTQEAEALLELCEDQFGHEDANETAEHKIRPSSLCEKFARKMGWRDTSAQQVGLIFKRLGFEKKRDRQGIAYIISQNKIKEIRRRYGVQEDTQNAEDLHHKRINQISAIRQVM
jgi:hypothetical protein